MAQAHGTGRKPLQKRSLAHAGRHLNDATDGVQSVKGHGGMVIAQDEASSAAFGMPGSAIATGCVDRVLPLEEIVPALCRLVEPEPRRPARAR